MTEASAARHAAHTKLEKALARDREVEQVVAEMARHDSLNNYTRLLVSAMTPKGRS